MGFNLIICGSVGTSRCMIIIGYTNYSWPGLNLKMMKKTTFYIFALIILAVSSSLSAAQNSDSEAIRKIVNEAYIEGIQNRGDIDVIRQGFSTDFEMIMFSENKIEKRSIEEWVSIVEEQKRTNPGPPEHPASAEILDVDITGNLAVVKLELYRQGKKQFTDFLTLHKFDEGWKIVSKTFYRH
jgi:hypothetical protein